MKTKKWPYLLVSILMPIPLLLVLLSSMSANGQFQDSGQALGGDLSFDAALADLDGDKDLDVFTANSQGNRVWLNQGGNQNGDAGIFQDSGQDPGFLPSRGLALGDLDGARGLDAFVVNDGDHQIWLNNGAAQFSLNQALFSQNIDSQDVALGLLDGDKALDAFVVNHGPNEVWFNEGGGGFTPGQDDLGDARSKEVALGDLDGDGDLDAYVANGSTGAEEDEIWWNNGQGKFSADDQTLDFDWNEGVALGDLDGDKDLDIFLAAWFGFDGVWFNQGGRQNGDQGTFQDSGQELSGNSSMDVALVDVDQDGDLDAIIAKWLLPNEVWINNGQGQFAKSDQELDQSATYEVAVGDLDLDGDPDLFFANSGPDHVWVMGGLRLPSAYFEVDARRNPAGQDVYPWAREGDARLPVILSFPAPENLAVEVQIEASTPYITDVIIYLPDEGQTSFDLRLQNPGLGPSSSLSLTLSTKDAMNTLNALQDQVNPLNLRFIDPLQGPQGCFLCMTDWVLKMAGFEPSFWMLHHFQLVDLRNSPSWEFYKGLFKGNEKQLQQIILSHPAIMWQLYDVLQVWTPAVSQYDRGQGDQAILTREMVGQADSLLLMIAEEADTSLARTIEREYAALDTETLPGQGIDQFMGRLKARVSHQVFLPLTSNPE